MCSATLFTLVIEFFSSLDTSTPVQTHEFFSSLDTSAPVQTHNFFLSLDTSTPVQTQQARNLIQSNTSGFQSPTVQNSDYLNSLRGEKFHHSVIYHHQRKKQELRLKHLS